MNHIKTLKENLLSMRLLGLHDDDIKILQSPSAAWQKQLQELIVAQKNNSAITIKKNLYWYHSQRNSQKETERAIATFQKNKIRYLIMVGAGLGHIPFWSLQENKIDSVFLIEPDLEILFYLLSLYNWQNKNIIILHNEKFAEKKLDHVLEFLRGKNSSFVQIYFHKASLQALPQLYSDYQIRLPELLRTRKVNQNTLIKFQETWNRNILLNASTMIHSGTLKKLLDKLKPLAKEVPFVIAGAGPSLLQSLPHLKKYRDRFLLIAADTAFIPLTKQEIYPDITLSVDPQWLNHYFVAHPKVACSLWLLDPAVCYANTRLLKSKKAKMFWWDNPFFLDEVIRNYLGSRGRIAHGGSVSTNAFDLAVQAKAKEIVLVGQDLSYPNLTAHVKGSVLEAAVFFKNDRFVTIENHNHKQMNSFSPIYMWQTDKTKKVVTSHKMQVFIEWFEEKAKNTTSHNINASAHGVYLHGFDHLNLEIFLQQKKPNNFSLTQSITKEKETPSSYITLKKVISNINKESQLLYNAYKENYFISKEVSTLLAQNQKPSTQQLQRLDQNDALNKKFHDTAKIISLGAQKSILQITEGSSEADPYTQGALFYRELMKSAFLISSLAQKVV